MTNKILEILEKHIDKEFVNDLVNSYHAVHNEYFNENYDNVLSKSGIFVENVFRVLNLIVFEEKLNEIEQGGMTKIFEKLEESPNKKFSDTIRLIIPRISMTVYTMRSKLGSEHVKTTKPDFIDAKFVISSCDWIVAELLRLYHQRDPEAIEKIIQTIRSEKQPNLKMFEVQLASKIDDIQIPDLVIVVLRATPSQTKIQIVKTIKHIGRNVGNWVYSSKFSSYLVKRGFVESTGRVKLLEVYSLTIKGILRADKLIDEIKTPLS